jgi:hypothetical protein
MNRLFSISGLALASLCVAGSGLAQNVVTIAAGRASEIPAAQYLDYSVQLPGPVCTVTGRIEGVSGGNKDFEALLLADDDFRNWSAGLQARAYWQSGRVTVTTISANLPGPAAYHLVVSNVFSLATPKTVQVWAQAGCAAPAPSAPPAQQVVPTLVPVQAAPASAAVTPPGLPGTPTTIAIAEGRASEVAAASYIQYAIQLPGNTCAITGRIEGVSGGNKDFEALLLGDDDFRNWSARLQANTYWQSGRVTVTNISAQVPGSATYHLVVSNAFSLATAKTVQVWAQADCR